MEEYVLLCVLQGPVLLDVLMELEGGLDAEIAFEGDSGGRGDHAGVCACPSNGTDPSCLIYCLCFVLA